MQDFKALGLPQALFHALERMQFTTPTPIQAQAIPLALQGKDILGTAHPEFDGLGESLVDEILDLTQHLLRPQQQAAPGGGSAPGQGVGQAPGMALGGLGQAQRRGAVDGVAAGAPVQRDRPRRVRIVPRPRVLHRHPRHRRRRLHPRLRRLVRVHLENPPDLVGAGSAPDGFLSDFIASR